MRVSIAVKTIKVGGCAALLKFGRLVRRATKRLKNLNSPSTALKAALKASKASRSRHDALRDNRHSKWQSSSRPPRQRINQFLVRRSGRATWQRSKSASGNGHFPPFSRSVVPLIPPLPLPLYIQVSRPGSLLANANRIVAGSRAAGAPARRRGAQHGQLGRVEPPATREPRADAAPDRSLFRHARRRQPRDAGGRARHAQSRPTRHPLQLRPPGRRQAGVH